MRLGPRVSSVPARRSCSSSARSCSSNGISRSMRSAVLAASVSTSRRRRCRPGVIGSAASAISARRFASDRTSAASTCSSGNGCSASSIQTRIPRSASASPALPRYSRSVGPVSADAVAASSARSTDCLSSAVAAGNEPAVTGSAGAFCAAAQIPSRATSSMATATDHRARAVRRGVSASIEMRPGCGLKIGTTSPPRAGRRPRPRIAGRCPRAQPQSSSEGPDSMRTPGWPEMRVCSCATQNWYFRKKPMLSRSRYRLFEPPPVYML